VAFETESIERHEKQIPRHFSALPDNQPVRCSFHLSAFSFPVETLALSACVGDWRSELLKSCHPSTPDKEPVDRSGTDTRAADAMRHYLP